MYYLIVKLYIKREVGIGRALKLSFLILSLLFILGATIHRLWFTGLLSFKGRTDDQGC